MLFRSRVRSLVAYSSPFVYFVVTPNTTESLHCVETSERKTPVFETFRDETLAILFEKPSS